MVHLGSARASLKALKANYSAHLKIHKEVMELSGGNRRVSVHGDRTGDDGRDSPEPSSDADGLCILKSPRHQRASGAHAPNQPGSSKSTATKLAAPRRLSAASPMRGLELSSPRMLRGQSTKLQVCKFVHPAAAKLGFSPHACRKNSNIHFKKRSKILQIRIFWNVAMTKK